MMNTHFDLNLWWTHTRFGGVPTRPGAMIPRIIAQIDWWYWTTQSLTESGAVEMNFEHICNDRDVDHLLHCLTYVWFREPGDRAVPSIDGPISRLQSWERILPLPLMAMITWLSGPHTPVHVSVKARSNVTIAHHWQAKAVEQNLLPRHNRCAPSRPVSEFQKKNGGSCSGGIGHHCCCCLVPAASLSACCTERPWPGLACC
jgi:hypothetical protein